MFSNVSKAMKLKWYTIGGFALFILILVALLLPVLSLAAIFFPIYLIFRLPFEYKYKNKQLELKKWSLEKVLE